jgi:hypothetical protein
LNVRYDPGNRQVFGDTLKSASVGRYLPTAAGQALCTINLQVIVIGQIFELLARRTLGAAAKAIVPITRTPPFPNSAHQSSQNCTSPCRQVGLQFATASSRTLGFEVAAQSMRRIMKPENTDTARSGMITLAKTTVIAGVLVGFAPAFAMSAALEKKGSTS